MTSVVCNTPDGHGDDVVWSDLAASSIPVGLTTQNDSPNKHCDLEMLLHQKL